MAFGPTTPHTARAWTCASDRPEGASAGSEKYCVSAAPASGAADAASAPVSGSAYTNSRGRTAPAAHSPKAAPHDGGSGASDDRHSREVAHARSGDDAPAASAASGAGSSWSDMGVGWVLLCGAVVGVV